MERGYSFLGVKCHKCREPLLRTAESETHDRVYCPSCLASGDYKEVAEQGAGLTNTPICDQELVDFIQKRWVARKLSRE